MRTMVLTLALVLLASGAQAQGRSASGRALGYELGGAALAESDIAQIPERVATALDACATEAAPLIGSSDLRARLEVTAAGTTRAVTLEGAPSGAPGTAARACVERALAALSFPRRRAETTVILDLEFREARPAAEDPRVVHYRGLVVDAMRTHQPAVHACFEAATAAHEAHDGTIRVEVTIDAEGRLTRVAVPVGDQLPRLTECLTRELRGWTVPRPPSAPFEMSHRFEGVVASYD